MISTVNIQHLESLADAVERISGVAIRERVPDWVLRSADQIELVDSSPEQLRRRMLHGNIYPADKIPQALNHFFRTENLTALRELALRFLADETDEDLLEYLRRHDVTDIWETTERILVCVTGAPGTDALLRQRRAPGGTPEVRAARRPREERYLHYLRPRHDRRPAPIGRGSRRRMGQTWPPTTPLRRSSSMRRNTR